MVNLFSVIVGNPWYWFSTAGILTYVMGVLISWNVEIDKSYCDWDPVRSKFVTRSGYDNLTPMDVVKIIFWPLVVSRIILAGSCYIVLRFLFSFWYAFTNKTLDQNPILVLLYKLI